MRPRARLSLAGADSLVLPLAGTWPRIVGGAAGDLPSLTLNSPDGCADRPEPLHAVAFVASRRGKFKWCALNRRAGGCQHPGGNKKNDYFS